MEYCYSYYDAGGLYIAAYQNGELYADVSVCLADYGIMPKENQIIIPFDKMLEEDYQIYLRDLAKKQLKTIRYGPYGAIGILVELKDNWQEICVSLE